MARNPVQLNLGDAAGAGGDQRVLTIAHEAPRHRALQRGFPVVALLLEEHLASGRWSAGSPVS